MVEPFQSKAGEGRAGAIGKRLTRKEDYRLLKGLAHFTDDLSLPGAVFARFVRSPHAHARILSVDARGALALEGVRAVVTGRELAQWTHPLRMAPPISGLSPLEVEALPQDKVRFHGDPVACVVAEDRYIAEDAADLVQIEYEVLDPALDARSSMQGSAPLVDESLTTNVVCEQHYSSGDPEAAFCNADHIVTARFSQHRQTHVPIETRGCAAVWDEGRQHLTFHVGTQVPSPYKSALAARLGLREDQVRLRCPDIGGAFGQKLALYREELVVAALARELGQPVRWQEDRRENLTAALHAREDQVEVQAAVRQDGEIHAIKAQLLSDFGAYSFFPANYMLQVVAMMIPGVYKVEHYAYDMHVVLSNKCPAAPFRAPMAICTWVTEGTIEAIARQLRLDPVQVRRRNMLRPNDLPYISASGERYEDITAFETFEALLRQYDYRDLRHRQQAGRARGRYIGVGLACVVEPTTYGSAFYKMAGIPGSGHEAARIWVDPDGTVNASIGLMGSGNGYETTIAQTVGDGLGVSPDDVAVHLGDTLVSPYGMGSRGSRGATAGAGTAYLAARDMKSKVLAIARAVVGLGPDVPIDMSDGRVVKAVDGGWADTDCTLKNVARTAYLDPLSLPDGLEPGLEIHKAYDPPAMTYSNAAHLCEVEVDADTGAIAITRYVVVEDAGTLINPQLVEGQLHGAIMLGLGGVLQEQVVYDARGHNLTDTLRDYPLPSASQAPTIEIIHHDTPNHKTPAGIKGMSEGGVMGSIAALCNAVGDALQPYGVVIDEQPLTPERIRKLLRGRQDLGPSSAHRHSAAKA